MVAKDNAAHFCVAGVEVLLFIESVCFFLIVYKVLYVWRLKEHKCTIPIVVSFVDRILPVWHLVLAIQQLIICVGFRYAHWSGTHAPVMAHGRAVELMTNYHRSKYWPCLHCFIIGCVTCFTHVCLMLKVATFVGAGHRSDLRQAHALNAMCVGCGDAADDGDQWSRRAQGEFLPRWRCLPGGEGELSCGGWAFQSRAW